MGGGEAQTPGRVSRLAWVWVAARQLPHGGGVASAPMPPCGTALGHPPCLREMHTPTALVGTGPFASRNFPLQETGSVGNTRASVLVFSGRSGEDEQVIGGNAHRLTERSQLCCLLRTGASAGHSLGQPPGPRRDRPAKKDMRECQ